MTATTFDTPTVSFADVKGEDRIAAVRDEIDAGVARLANPEGWAAFLDSYAKFHQYSFGNHLLASIQRPDATRLASFKSWKDNFNRTVISGEKAVWIWAPLSYNRKQVDEKTGEETKITGIRGFRLVPVFDVAQTEGDPLPENPVTYTLVDGEAPEGVAEELTELITDRGFEVRYEELERPEHGGYTSFGAHLVVVNTQNSGAEQARTLAHELAHIALDHGSRTAEYHVGDGRSDMEIEAESVAYVLARHFGIPTESSAFSYIAGWAKGDTDKVKATATAVLKAAKDLLPAA